MDVSGTQIVKRGTKNQAVEKSREAAETDYGQTYILPSGAGAPGDYLYGSQPLNDLWMGMWGIFRVPAKRLPDLQPLPTNPAPATGAAGTEWPALKPGGAIAAPTSAPKPCATTAPTRTYNISMIKTKITYNKQGDHDPNGVMYVENTNLDAAGKPKPGVELKPLFIRANEGDCLNITLTNRLPLGGTKLEPGDPLNPVEKIGDTGTSAVTNLENGALKTVQPVWPAGNRASLHPSGLVKYYAISASGSAIGYNFDTTIAPGKSYTYKYYVDTKNIGVANFADYGNLRTNRHHGAWGGLIVEPKGSTFLKPKDLTALTSGDQAVIKYTDASGAVRSHREFVVDFQDGLNLYDASGKQIKDAAPGDVPGAPVDAEDEGEVGVNYRSEGFLNRLSSGKSSDPADVFSSAVHGDPSTPVFRAYTKDPTMVRVLNSSDLPRVHTFGISGHSWKYEQNDSQSNVINGQGGLNTGRAFNAGICTGSNTPLFDTSTTPTCAAVTDANAGDYLYNDRNFFHMLSGGIWGIIRVHGTTQTDLKPLPAK
jgi:manganese oxidase